MTHRNSSSRLAAFGLCLAALAFGGVSRALPAPLQLVGILGQSQPDGAAAPFLDTNGVAQMADGTLWVGANSALYEYEPGAAGTPFQLIRTVPMPRGFATDNAIQRDGTSKLTIASGDGWIYQLDTAAGDPHPIRMLQLPDGAHAYAVAPAGLTQGVGAIAPVVALDKNQVFACKPGSQTPLFTLPTVEGGYGTLCVEPLTGNILVASSYPDMKVYRYDATGRQITAGGWPRAGFIILMANVRGLTWGLKAGRGAISLPADLASTASQTFGTGYQYPPRGFAPASDGGYWLASAEGVAHLDAWGEPDGGRLGGMPNVTQLALAGDGSMIAVTDGGALFVRLHDDDRPGDLLDSNSNNVWSTDSRWDVSAGIVRSGADCIVLDKTNHKLYQFRPDHTGDSDTPWIELPTAAPLTSPTSIAGGEATLWVADGNAVLETPIGPTLNLQPTVLPDYQPAQGRLLLAASPDETTLFVTDGTSVTAFSRDSHGQYARLWQTPAQNIISMAASISAVYLIRRDAPTVVTAIDTSSGKSTDYSVTVGQTPCAASAVAYHEKFLVVADSANARLLLYRVQQ